MADAIEAIDPFGYAEELPDEWRRFRVTRITSLVAHLRTAIREIETGMTDSSVTLTGRAGFSYESSAIPPEWMSVLTVDMQIRYLGAARETDLVAEGWITKRGRSIVFCQAEVRTHPGGDLVAEGWLTYKVSA